MNKKATVIVAGGGIGGLSAALGLGNKGCSVTVLEQADRFGEIGAGIQIGPNAFHAMDYLGVGDAGRAKAVYIDRLIMMDGITGTEIAHIPVDEPFRKRFGNPYAVIHRFDLHGVLLDACRRHGDISLVNKQRVVGSDHTAAGAQVRTEDGSVFAADAVIGCDGIRSKIRERLAGGDPLSLSGHVAYRAVLPIEQMPEDLRWNAATLWAGPKCHMVHYPLQGWKTFNLVATFQTEVESVGVNEPGNREEILSRFGHIVHKARKLLEIPTEWRRWVLGDREPIENWDRGPGDVARRRSTSHAPVFRAGRVHGDGGRGLPRRPVRALAGQFHQCPPGVPGEPYRSRLSRRIVVANARACLSRRGHRTKNP